MFFFLKLDITNNNSLLYLIIKEIILKKPAFGNRKAYIYYKSVQLILILLVST